MRIENVSNRLMGRALIFAVCIGAACTIFASAAHAQAPIQKSKVTFSQPVEIPDVGAQVLPAGTYVFKLVDSTSDRHIVQIFSQDEKHVFATILAVPNYRLKPTDHTVITFTERASDSPQAIRKYLQDYGYRLPALRDPEHALVKLAHVQITPEVAVFDREHHLAYEGRIDDRYVDFFRQRPAPTTHELEDALRAVLAGKPAARGEVRGVGCYISDLP